MVIIKSNIPPLGGSGLSRQRTDASTPVNGPGAPPGTAVPAPGPGAIVPGPGIGGPGQIQRNLVRLAEQEQDVIAGQVPQSKLTKAVARPVPVVYYVFDPITDTWMINLAQRLSFRNAAFFADMTAGTVVITYNAIGGAPIVEIGGDFEIPGTEGRMISSLRFGQVKRLGNIAEP